jgi:hypothetical protein
MTGGEVEDRGAVDGLDLSTERLEAFSDGVMAVIITLMAFELKVPSSATFDALRHELPSLLVYVLSFANIGIYWNNHHHLLRLTPKISPAVMWSNLNLLLWLSLIPVLTGWVGQQYRHSLPAAAYGVGGGGGGAGPPPRWCWRPGRSASRPWSWPTFPPRSPRSPVRWSTSCLTW